MRGTDRFRDVLERILEKVQVSHEESTYRCPTCRDVGYTLHGKLIRDMRYRLARPCEGTEVEPCHIGLKVEAGRWAAVLSPKRGPVRQDTKASFLSRLRSYRHGSALRDAVDASLNASHRESEFNA